MGANRWACDLGAGARAAVIALALALVGGCAYDGASLAEKQASFRAVASDRVDGQLLARFLALRTAALFPGTKPTSVRETSAGTRMTFADDRVHLGSAIALTPDGYLLTAAHCVDTGPLFAWISVADGVGHALVPVRVVWLGDAESDDLDLALLHVDAPLAATFAWADDADLTGGEDLLSAGMTYRGGGPTPTFAAGLALGALPQPEPTRQGAPGVATVEHGVPLRKGDSGGPLATRDGRLVGVNVRGTWFLGHRTQVALRPARAWIEGRIERDRLDRRSAIMLLHDRPAGS